MKHFLNKIFLCISLLIILPPISSLSQINIEESTTNNLIKQSLTAASDTLQLSILIALTSRFLENNLDSALLFGHKALKLAKSNEDKEKLAVLHEYLGRIYKSSSKVDSAFFHLDKAKETSNKPLVWMNVYLQKSSLYQLSGHYDQALYSLMAMDSIAKKTKNLDYQGKAMASIGELWRIRDQPTEALNYLKKAASIFQEIGNTNNYLWVSGRIASSYRDLEANQKGIEQILEILAEKHHPFLSKNNFALNHNTLGHLYADDQKLDKAEQHFLKSIELSREIGRDYFVQNGLNRLVDIYTQQNQFQKGIEAGLEALKLCEGGKDFRNLRNIHFNLYKTYEQIDSISQSLFHLKQHHVFKDSLANIERLKIAEELEGKYKNELQAQEILTQEKNLEIAATQRNAAILIGLLIATLVFLFFRHRNIQKQKEAAILAERTEELERLDALKSRFFANISHELRTPLTLIWGPLNAILNKKMGPVNSNIEHSLKIIKNNSQRLLELIEEILDLSKLDANKMELQLTKISLKSFIQRITFAFESATEIKNIDFKINNLLSGNLVLETDKRKLEKIFNNLISNALKFTPENGEIIFIADIKDNGNLHFKIKDSGRGIHPDDLPNIFNRFYQSNKKDAPVEGGTGIGLALSKEFATLLGGSLTAKSEFGKGSLFTLELPKSAILENATVEKITNQNLSKTEIEKAVPIIILPESPIISNTASDISTTLLIVEDNREMQAFLNSVLSPNYQIVHASNGKIALEKLKNPNHHIDLILSDVMMPEMDGFTLLEALKSDEILLQIPVIMLTARADMRDKLKALNAGVDDYMTKPFEEEELKIRIKNLLENQSQRNLTKSEAKSTKDSTIRKADLDWLKKVEDALKREVANSHYTLISLADELAISKSQLFRKIKLLTGITPNKYYREIKLNLAKELLEDRTYTTMAEVSYAIGFDDPQYFSKIYFERFGKRPSAYF